MRNVAEGFCENADLMMKPLEWDDLRVFLAICRHGTLSAAARELKVNQTTVSRRLSALEATLDARLFDRLPEGFVPSEVGKGVLESAEAMEAQALAVQRQASGEDKRLEGVVRMTCTEPFLVHHLMPNFAAFRQSYPGIEVEVHTGYQTLSLLRREADLAVRLIPTKEAELIAHRVLDLAIAPHVSRKYLKAKGLTADAPLDEMELIASGLAGEEWPETRWFRSQAPKAKTVLRLNSVLGLAAAAKAGVGVAMIPCFLGAKEDLVRLRPPVPELKRTISLVFHRDLQKTARVRALIDFITDMLRRHAPELTGTNAA